MTFKRLLVPTDFSESSLKALDYAIQFARSHGTAELILLHVIEGIRHTRYIPDVSALLEQQRAEAADRIAELEQRVRRRRVKCRAVLHFGIPYQVIAENAEKCNADLIIIATHGHTGLAHLFLGSVAERVVRVAKCPVLTVRALPVEAPVARRRRRPRARIATR
jgi:universal stress protein A